MREIVIMVQSHCDRRLFRGAVLASILALAAGYGWYAHSLARLPAPMPVTTADAMFDPVTGANRMFFPTATEDLSGPVGVQGRTHLVIAAIIAMSVALAIVPWKRRDVVVSSDRFDRIVLAAYIASLAGAAWLLMNSRQTSWIGAAVGVGASLLFVFGSRAAGRPRANVALGLLALVAIGLWHGPGLWIRVDLSTDPWWKNEVAEKHLSLTVSFGDRLAQGLKLYEEVIPGYSGLLAIAKAAYVRWIGPTSALTDVVFVQATHLVYVLLATWCYYLYSGRRCLMVLVALLFLGSSCNFALWTFYHAPNHTAWRTIMFPVALLGAYFSARLSPKREAIVLGLISGFGILQNFESGMAIAAGLGWSLLCRNVLSNGSVLWRSAGVLSSFFVIGLAAAVALHGAVCLVPLGYVPDYVEMVRRTAEIMRVVGTGYGGGAFQKFDPLAFVILAHASIAFIFETIRAKRAPITSHRCNLRLAAATMILIWFKYYFNRPDPIYLNSFYVLYGVLLIDLFRVIAASRYRYSGGLRETAVVAVVVLIVTIVPRARLDYDLRIADYVAGWKRVRLSAIPSNAIDISGFWLPDDSFAKGLKAKADFIRMQSQHGPVAYLTENCYFVPKLSGVWSDLPVVQPFWECGSPPLFDRLVRVIVESKHDEIFFDAPETIVAPEGPHPNFRDAQFYRYLKKALENDFQRTESVSGWERWRRKVRD